MRQLGVLSLLLVLLAGCTTSEVRVAHSIALVPATETIPEEQLLDVGVVLFDPGVPEGEVDKEVAEELIREGTFINIRRAEARYMAVELRDTLQDSGYWGSVWVLPRDSTAADLIIRAEILHSDGDFVNLDITAVDASGRVWLDDEYALSTAIGSYNRQRYPDLDPYQDLFNSIANDLAAARAELRAAEVEDLRSIAQLRFAEELSPQVFDGYVEVDGRGIYQLRRLPAEDDPQYFRSQRVREREHVFIDTLNQHYADFYQDAGDSYDGWREYAREEAISIRELQRSSRWRTGMGIATIVASVLYGANSDGQFSDRIVRDTLMYMGMDLIRTARVRREEKRLHAEALEELSASFDEEVRPLVVEIEGTQHRLTGTAEIQYEEWRELLRQLYEAETGFTTEIDVYTEEQAETLEPDDGLETTPIDAEAFEAEGDAQQAPADNFAGATAGI
ncbi:MAG TPA: hypothetical protein VGC50_09385 [Gammaproteobacteria bacterium]|jgi:hypothetical protein